MEKSYPYLITRVRDGLTRYFFNNGGTPRKDLPLGGDWDTAVSKWKLLIKDRPAASEKPKVEKPARQKSVPFKPVPIVYGKRSFASKTKAKKVLKPTPPTSLGVESKLCHPSDNAPKPMSRFVPRPLSEIYINYIPPKGIVTPFDLEKWNAGRVSIFNPLHPSYRR